LKSSSLNKFLETFNATNNKLDHGQAMKVPNSPETSVLLLRTCWDRSFEPEIFQY
jgi:hypothetical protein